MLTNTLFSHTGSCWMCARGLGSGEKCGTDVTQEAFKDQNMCVTAASEALKLFQTPFNHLFTDFSWSLHIECELNMYRAQVCTRDICCLSVWNQLWGTYMCSQNAIKCCKTHYILVFAVLRVIQESDGRSIQKGALFCTCGCTFFLCEVILLAVSFTRNQDKLQSKVETFSFY